MQRTYSYVVSASSCMATQSVCSSIYPSGEPNYEHSDHPDYVPFLRLNGKENDTPAMHQKIQRYERAQNHKVLRDASSSNQSSCRKEDAIEQKQQTASLTKENDSLKVQVVSLKTEVASLTAEVESLKADTCA